MIPRRSPIPAPFESANDRGYTWYTLVLCHHAGPPPVLCSTVNAPEQYAVQCPFRLMPYEEVVDVDASRQFETAVGIARLNPYNLYHALFEVSLYSCMCSQRDRHLISAV